MTIEDHQTDMAICQEIGLRIRRVRIQAQMRQDELAARAGVSRFSIIKLENGEVGVRLNTLLAVLRVLGLLHLLEGAFPRVELSPLEVARLEAQSKKFPKRVRTRKTKATESGLWNWGESVALKPTGARSC